MKPKIFKVDKVFRAFRDKNFIATFRTEYPEETEFWIRRSRTGEKKFEAELKALHKVNQGEENKFAELFYHKPTGFSSIREWVQAVKQMHGETPSGWILVLQKKGEQGVSNNE